MDRQKIFDGLLKEFRNRHNDLYQLSDRAHSAYRKFFARLLAKSELLLFMKESFHEINVDHSDADYLLDSFDDIFEIVFSDLKKLEIRKGTDLGLLKRELANTEVPQFISFAIRIKHLSKDGDEFIDVVIPAFYEFVSDEFIDIQDYVVALASIELAIACNTERAESHYKRGEIFNKLTDYKEAISSFEKAINLKPDYILARSAKDNAEALLTINKYAAALGDAKELSKRLQRENWNSQFWLWILRVFNFAMLTILFFLTFATWLLLYDMVFNGAAPLEALSNLFENFPADSLPKYSQKSSIDLVSHFLSIISISSATLLLVSPVIWAIRRIHHDMKIERIAIEDKSRKNVLLLSRDLFAGDRDSDETIKQKMK